MIPIPGWLVKLGAGVLAVLGIFWAGISKGKDKAKIDSLEAKGKAERETAETLTERQADEQKAVEEAHTRSERRDFD